MLLCDLPEDVQAIVLRESAVYSYNGARSFKRNLPLLAVCPLWRRLATPLVYSQVFVQYGDRPKRRPGTFIRRFSVEPTDVAVKTNLDLVAMVGCAHAVERVQIDVYCMSNPFPGWREVIRRMRVVASKWCAVELEVAMYPDSSYLEAHGVDMAEFTDDIVEVRDALASLMPDVRSLDCRGANKNPIARSLYGHLASHYADQLESFDSCHPITVPPDCQFTRLKRFATFYDGVTDYQPPRIASGELVDMRLINAPANHSWASFASGSDSQEIEFTNLKYLFAGYHIIHREDGVAVRHRDGHPWKLHFPSLECLDLKCSEDICPLLEYAVLPPSVEAISIQMKSATYLDIANVELPATKHLSLRVTFTCDGDPSGLPVVNRILERARGSETVGLVIEDEMLQVLPESITSTALTHLHIWSTISVDTMLALIGKLPSLVLFSLSRLDTSDIQADISIPDADEDTAVEPLSLSLKHLIMSNGRSGHSPDMAAAVVKYVLLKLPGLAVLSSRQIPRTQVLDFVKERLPRYPHLGAVKLILDE